MGAKRGYVRLGSDGWPPIAGATAVMTAKPRLRVGFLVACDESRLGDEEREALAWLRREPNAHADLVSFQAMTRGDRLDAPVLWWHGAWTSERLPQAAIDPRARKAILEYLRAGGGLLLTLMAAAYAHDLGIEPIAPDVRVAGAYREADGPKRGFHSFLGHPIFDPFFGGVFTATPEPGEPRYDVVYTGAHVPRAGHVIGVERALIAIDPGRRLVVEWTFGQGRVLAIGSHLLFGHLENRFRPHLEAFTRRTLEYLGSTTAPATPSHWTFPAARLEWVDERSSPEIVSGPPVLRPDSDIVLSGPARDDFFDLAGRRALVMGSERAGIAEAWVHPIRILRDLRLGVHEEDSGHIVWLDALEPDVEVRPDSLLRHYRPRIGSVEEILIVSPDHPAVLDQVRVQSREATSLLVTFRVDLRLMWPYPENALAPLAWTYDAGIHAVVVRDAARRFVSIIGADREPIDRLAGPYAGIAYEGGAWRGLRPDPTHLTVGLRFPVTTTPLRLVLAGGAPPDPGAAVRSYRDAQRDPRRMQSEAFESARAILASHVSLATSDPSLDEGFRWAILGSERFLAGRPEFGCGLLAGFGLTRPGWNSGRPGYAWYFGRDAAWCGFGLDAAGSHETVRSAIELLGRYQDITGKIPHEVTTSGVVHYDAADSTPLYLALLGHHARATGDVAFAREHWPRAIRALAYCRSTDTDGDGLIENSGVGHGWIEGGALHGSHVETYLVACWARALSEAARLAEWLGDRDVAAGCHRDFLRVREALNRDFFDPSRGTFHLGRFRDGSFNPELTALAAVPILFGLADREKAESTLARLAGHDFTTDWGMRLVSQGSPHFDPNGYHLGSVWPLFTGWVSLAEYRAHRPAQAFAHLMMNLLQFRHFGRGFVDEVLHGTRYAPAGVCPHQAWSETMVLEPLLEGLLGFEPDATTGHVGLTPHLPPHLETFRVRALRVGGRRFDFEATRTPGRLEIRLRLLEGAPLRVRLDPGFGPGTSFGRVCIDGKREGAPFAVEDNALDVHASVELYLNDERTVTFEHSGEVAVVPIVPRLEPNAFSSSPKIVSFRRDGDRFRVEVDGRSATNSEVELRVHGRSIRSVSGGALQRSGEGAWLVGVPIPEGALGWGRAVVELQAPRDSQA